MLWPSGSPCSTTSTPTLRPRLTATSGRAQPPFPITCRRTGNRTTPVGGGQRHLAVVRIPVAAQRQYKRVESRRSLAAFHGCRERLRAGSDRQPDLSFLDLEIVSHLRAGG